MEGDFLPRPLGLHGRNHIEKLYALENVANGSWSLMQWQPDVLTRGFKKIWWMFHCARHSVKMHIKRLALHWRVWGINKAEETEVQESILDGSVNPWWHQWQLLSFSVVVCHRRDCLCLTSSSPLMSLEGRLGC